MDRHALDAREALPGLRACPAGLQQPDYNGVMPQRVIPLADLRHRGTATPSAPGSAKQTESGLPIGLPTPGAPLPETNLPPGMRLADPRGRVLRDLRISVTDRCNFRCVYCMPREVFDARHQYLPHDALLSFEEITRLTRLAVARGIGKIRLTGGEPLLRRRVEDLVAMLSALQGPDGRPVEVTLTTNGLLLPKKAAALRAAGLARVTVSLDSLDDALFRRINDADCGVAEILAGIDAARAAGFTGIKVNAVIKRGMNDQEILPLVRHFGGTGVTVRFIEYMDVGVTNGWNLADVVPAAEMLARILAEVPLEAVEPAYPGEVAKRWRRVDGAGEVGFITSVSQAFCGDCTRARLSTEGVLYTCLFAQGGHDLRALLRGGADDERIDRVLAGIWTARSDRYSEIRGAATAGLERIEMSYIGG